VNSHSDHGHEDSTINIVVDYYYYVMSSPLHLTVEMKFAKIVHERFYIGLMIFGEHKVTFTFAICHMLSPIRLSSVCNARAPYQNQLKIFVNVSKPFGTLAVH